MKKDDIPELTLYQKCYGELAARKLQYGGNRYTINGTISVVNDSKDEVEKIIIKVGCYSGSVADLLCKCISEAKWTLNPSK